MTLTITIPLWLLYTVGGVLTFVFLLLTAIGAFVLWQLQDGKWYN